MGVAGFDGVGAVGFGNGLDHDAVQIGAADAARGDRAQIGVPARDQADDLHQHLQLCVAVAARFGPCGQALARVDRERRRVAFEIARDGHRQFEASEWSESDCM